MSKIKFKHNLVEANVRRYIDSNSTERRVKQELIKLLKDDGNGNHHAKYAQVLENFDFKIVPIGKKPETAAVNAEEGIVYLNRGFLSNKRSNPAQKWPDNFYQLSLVLRHEILHAVLKHELRMLAIMKSIPKERLNGSCSLHSMFNTIMDFEVSNKGYRTREDRYTAAHLLLNGKIISGLITEDHRDAWKYYSLEQMYDALDKEIAMSGDNGSLKDKSSYNLIKDVADLHNYKQNGAKSPDFSSIEELKKYLDKNMTDIRTNKHYPAYDNYMDVINKIQQEVEDNTAYKKQDIQSMIDTVLDSRAADPVSIKSPVTKKIICTAYTPEEKELTIETLKIAGKFGYEEDYNTWYSEVMRVLGSGEFTDDEIEAVAKDLGLVA